MERTVLHWVCVLALGAVPLVGCTDVVEFTTYPMEVTESNQAVPLEGVEICQADADPPKCVTTDARGRADLEVLSNQEVAFTFEKEGFGPLLLGDVSDETFGPQGLGDGQVSRWPMYTHAELSAIADQLQTQYPWERGIVGLGKWVFPNTGVTFAPVGSTIDAVGEAFYFDASTEQYSLDLEATTAFSGAADKLPLVQGGFTDVTPGEQQFEFGGTAGDCLVSWGWPGDAPNRIRVPVRKGFRTYGSMACD